MTNDTTADLSAPHKIVVLNPKGGCGKTTLATNIASHYALDSAPPTLVDCDPGGFSVRWADKRPVGLPPVYGIAAYDCCEAGSRPIRAWPGSNVVIVDLPGGLKPDHYFRHTYDADSILIPIVPSEIDIHSATKFIADLLLIAQFDRRNRNLAIVANRTRFHTRSYRMLMRFLASLEIPIIAELRDSQNYVHAAAEGMGVSELPRYRVAKDLNGLDDLFAWLDRWRTRRIDGLLVEEIHGVPAAPNGRVVLATH